MIRGLSIGAVIAAAAFGAAATLSADPPSGEIDVPGMVYGAALGAPCSNSDRYIFGRSASGQAMACISDGAESGQWVKSAPLYGVQQVGAACSGGDGAAQSPDGRGLVCAMNEGWQPGP